MRIILLRNPLVWFFGILGFEAVISLLDLSVLPGAMPVTRVLGYIFPVIGNIAVNPSVSTSVAPYIALTCALMPVKVYIAYLYVLQISPEEKSLIVSFPLSEASLARKLFSTAFLVIFSVGMMWYVFIYYGNVENLHSDVLLKKAAAKYDLVTSGGINMWFGWSVMYLLFVASILGLTAAFVGEWLRLVLIKIRSHA